MTSELEAARGKGVTNVEVTSREGTGARFVVPIPPIPTR